MPSKAWRLRADYHISFTTIWYKQALVCNSDDSSEIKAQCDLYCEQDWNHNYQNRFYPVFYINNRDYNLWDQDRCALFTLIKQWILKASGVVHSNFHLKVGLWIMVNRETFNDFYKLKGTVRGAILKGTVYKI